jgi:uncharacterized membrane protein YkvI
MNNTRFQRLWLPGLVFQSVYIGGGYATGRELVEFFLSLGPWAGILGLAVATVSFSVVLMLTLELARQFAAFDYRTLFKQILGRFWFGYEILYIAMILVVLAVLGAAAGEIVAQTFGAPGALGTVGLMAAICLLVFFGTRAIERFLAAWSFVLYATYAAFFVLCFSAFGDDISQTLRMDHAGSGWFAVGIKYVGYNLSVIPAIVFTARHLESRRDAFTAGLLCGPIATIPGVLFFLAMVGKYPQILDAPVPLTFLLDDLGIAWLTLVFPIVIFGTFIESGSAVIHAMNERIDHVYGEHGASMPTILRPAIAIGTLVAAIYLATTFGLVDLIARGFGYLTYGFLAVYLVPLLTRGTWLIFKGARQI